MLKSHSLYIMDGLLVQQLEVALLVCDILRGLFLILPCALYSLLKGGLEFAVT